MDLEFKDFVVYDYHVIMSSEDYKIIEDFSEGLSATKHNNGVCGYIDKIGKETFLFNYDVVEDFHEGLAIVQNKNGLYGFINKKFEEVIPCSYIFATKFKFGYAIVKNNEESFIINNTGKIVEYIDDSTNLEKISKILYSKKLINKKTYEEDLKKEELKSEIIKKSTSINLTSLKAYSYYDNENNKIIPYDNIENRDFHEDFVIVRVDRNDIRIFNKKGKQLKIHACITFDENTSFELIEKIKQFKYKISNIERRGFVSIFKFNDKEYKITANDIKELNETKKNILTNIKESLSEEDINELIKYKIKSS